MYTPYLHKTLRVIQAATCIDEYFKTQICPVVERSKTCNSEIEILKLNAANCSFTHLLTEITFNVGMHFKGTAQSFHWKNRKERRKAMKDNNCRKNSHYYLQDTRAARNSRRQLHEIRQDLHHPGKGIGNISQKFLGKILAL